MTIFIIFMSAVVGYLVFDALSIREQNKINKSVIEWMRLQEKANLEVAAFIKQQDVERMRKE